MDLSEFAYADFVKERRLRAIEEILSHHADMLKGRKEINSWVFSSMKTEQIPDAGLEFLVWDEFLGKRYWRGVQELSRMFTRVSASSRFSEEDLLKLTRSAIDQVYGGEEIAARVPMYSDVWNDFGSKDESPLKKFVTHEDMKRALNTGFWDCLEKSTDLKKLDHAGQELGKIFEYTSFYTDFDYRAGIEKAVALPFVSEIRGFGNWDLYLIWYLSQDEQIRRESDIDKGLEVRGKLAAPLVHSIFDTSEYDSHAVKFRRLLSYFMVPDLIKTKSIQSVLGNFFERELESALRGDDYDSEHFNIVKRNLLDAEERARIVVGKEEIDVRKVHSDFERYIPKEYYTSYIADLKEKLLSKERFDPNAFCEWDSGNVLGKISGSQHSLVKNHALFKYLEESPRPGIKTVKTLYQHIKHGDKPMLYTAKGGIFSDFIFRREWKYANDILLMFQNEMVQSRHCWTFLQGIVKYVEQHGKIPLREDGLDIKRCFPSYNMIPDFAQRYERLFEMKKMPGKKE